MAEAVEVTLARIDERMDSLVDSVRAMDKLLRGNGDEPGLKGRVDRLEQTEVRRVWWIRGAVSASISALVATVARLFRGD